MGTDSTLRGIPGKELEQSNEIRAILLHQSGAITCEWKPHMAAIKHHAALVQHFCKTNRQHTNHNVLYIPSYQTTEYFQWLYSKQFLLCQLYLLDLLPREQEFSSYTESETWAASKQMYSDNIRLIHHCKTVERLS